MKTMRDRNSLSKCITEETLGEITERQNLSVISDRKLWRAIIMNWVQIQIRSVRYNKNTKSISKGHVKEIWYSISYMEGKWRIPFLSSNQNNTERAAGASKKKCRTNQIICLISEESLLISMQYRSICLIATLMKIFA